MAITMWCDHCGEEIPSSTNGGVRVRTADREIRLHLCGAHQKKLREMVESFAAGKAVEVSPSLRKP